ncbi:hypothetical protein LTR70_005871 [Exophiala xenobiotica]|uniref:UDP-galactose transporter n=1 Tax=Lithohypha guttulata TaxID=1690604 RepID=A0ABR0KA01_9EURO|nr:hypothetical protein LTR24_005467 [Lithohypha guttulata]KAK5317371.1 hypothetical protein LTR70_005871 [Exophiala xenobiotica]
MRYSRTSSGPRYHTSTAVLLSEALKCLISLMGVLYTKHYERNHEQGPASPLGDPVRFPLSPQKDQPYHGILSIQRVSPVLSLLVPSILYTVQNNLQFVAVSNLDAATFQVAYQGKILTTAICAVIFLGKKLSTTQSSSIILLAAGVACASVPATATTQQALSHRHQDHARGIAAVSMACLISGFAGVYTESILKKTQTQTQQITTTGTEVRQTNILAFWHRNLHLCLTSLVSAALSVLIIDKDQITTHGFWHGYNRTVWAVIVLQAIGGLTVALVITYTDNILKGFATSISVIVSTVATAVFWEFELTPLFVVGVVAVLAATHMYCMAGVSGAAASEGGRYRRMEEIEGGNGVGVGVGDGDGGVGELKRVLVTYQHVRETSR